MNSTNLNTTTEQSNCRLYRVGGCPYFDFFNNDCLELMKTFPDNHFDLAVVDVPYGIGEDGSKNHTRSKMAVSKNYKGYSGNDKHAPGFEYWNELHRISKNQIVWGANHFISKLPFDSSCWIVWDKENGENDFADCELAWTSFNTAVRKFKWKWHGMLQQNMKNKQVRIHPNEKPIELYSWIIQNYAKPDFKILDTHLGSSSIAIAVHKANVLDKMNLHLTGIEIDADYFQAAMNRIKKHVSQGTLPF